MIETDDNGLVHLLSAKSVPDTMASLEAVVVSRSLGIAARVNHSQDAVRAGLYMPPTQLLIFGNPAAGTPLMLASPAVTIDLPLKALAWQDHEGRVWLSYNHPDYLQRRHQFPKHLAKNIDSIKSICEEALLP